MTTPHDHDTIEDFVPFFKAFCNATRAQIIEFLLARRALRLRDDGAARRQPAAGLAPPGDAS